MPSTIKRRHLPHWHIPGATYFITYRLAGTIPREKLEEWNALRQSWLNNRPDNIPEDEHDNNTHKRVFKLMDDYLDADKSIDWLTRPVVAPIIRESLLHNNGQTHHLQSWCIMPNHVHALIKPLEPDTARQSALSRLMEGKKGYSARFANKALERSGEFWEQESYDHWVRNQFELERILEYIRMNPVKAGFVKEPWEWVWSSCYDRFKLDGDKTGFLAMPKA